MIRIGLLSVRGEIFHPSARLKAAAQARGHEVVVIHPHELGAHLGGGNPPGLLSETLSSKGLPDVILPRQGAPMGEYGMVILSQLESMGIPLVNGSQGVALARNQFLSLQVLSRSGIAVPRSHFIVHKDFFDRALGHLGGYPVVVKQVSGLGGEGVALLENSDQAGSYLEKFVPGDRGLVVQEYLPPKNRVDLRVLVVGQRVVGAMSLTPSGDDFRANVHQQGRARAVAFDPLWEDLALRAARVCHLDVAGVDMMIPQGQDPLVCEVNYSPGFRGLEAATGIDVAGAIVEYAVERFNTREGSRYEN
ncbi:MAG: RimK family alpha-L-glutamate ligase [Desulfovibrionales bacterium]|nr:RimK family alpha-L-glutamate ligase [Desulfovibrionales bacterium]